MEGGGIEHRKLAVEQIDQLCFVLDIRSHDTNTFSAIKVTKNLRRAIGKGHLVIAGRGEQPGDGGANLAGTDHNDVLHALSRSSTEGASNGITSNSFG